MTSPTPTGGARLARLRRTAARLRQSRPSQPPQAATTTAASPTTRTSSASTTTPSPSSSPVTTAHPAANRSADTGRWWTRLERSVALLVSVSTLVAAGTALATVRQATGEQHLTRDGQVTDRYTAAVANLGDSSEEIRLGGLYALQRIARDSPRDASTIAQVISAYVRSRTPLPKRVPLRPLPLASDVAAALSILTDPRSPHAAANLAGANLSGAYLPHADLSGADLHGASLYGANLYGARLTGVNFSHADLQAAELGGSDLTGAYMPGANLFGAGLRGADLQGADLQAAILSDADLNFASLCGADLTNAHRPEGVSMPTRENWENCPPFAH